MILSVHLFFILTPRWTCFFMFCHLTFILKRPHTHVHKPLKLCWLWRADGRLKFSLDDDFVLVRDSEVISHRLCVNIDSVKSEVGRDFYIWMRAQGWWRLLVQNSVFLKSFIFASNISYLNILLKSAFWTALILDLQNANAKFSFHQKLNT